MPRLPPRGRGRGRSETSWPVDTPSLSRCDAPGPEILLKLLRRGDDAGEAARAPVVPAAPVADLGLGDRLTAWAYVGAGGAAAAGGLGLGWVASDALPLDGVAAGDAPAARDAPGLPDILDDVLGAAATRGQRRVLPHHHRRKVQTSRGAPQDISDPPQPGHNGDVAWEGVEGSYAVRAAGEAWRHTAPGRLRGRWVGGWW
eukprot:jgi/Tetstr1/460250/TSEL_000485.t1